MTNAALDAIWLREAQDRLAAFRRGEIEAFDEVEVFDDMDEIRD